MIVTLADIRAIGYCNNGARLWFARHGLDWAAFVRQGVAEETLAATGDAMAAAAIAQARKRIEAEA